MSRWKGWPGSVYARFSTDRQDKRSIEDQVRRCLALAKLEGIHVSQTHVFSDAAESGSHLQRGDLQRMLALARRRGGSPFRILLVDDLSRLSRDMGDAWTLVFRDLLSVNVVVLDATTRMPSDAPAARMTYGAIALANDAFLQMVRAETHRGVERRAIDGFSTGGRV